MREGCSLKKGELGRHNKTTTLRASNCKNLLRQLLLMQLPVSGGKSTHKSNKNFKKSL